MMTYCVKTPEMGVSILSDGVGNPLSVCPAADNELFFFIKFVLVRNFFLSKKLENSNHKNFTRAGFCLHSC